jgi:hypothetical protein
MQAARARGSAILRQPHASWACTSIIDISKNKCAVAITTVERDMVRPHSMYTKSSYSQSVSSARCFLPESRFNKFVVPSKQRREACRQGLRGQITRTNGAQWRGQPPE